VAAEVKPRSNRLFVLIGIVLAVAAFGLSLYVSRSGGGDGTATQSVVVAKADIAMHQVKVKGGASHQVIVSRDEFREVHRFGALDTRNFQ
jgi:hypothetical protein